MEATVEWMVSSERGYLKCRFEILVGGCSGCSNGDIKVRFPISSDLQLASFFSLASGIATMQAMVEWMVPSERE
jgi:Fe-S cluster biogenesis protein NfuA